MATQAKLEDSNIAAYGSKAHKDVKLAAAKTAPEWKGAGVRCGTQIWRVEKLKIKQWPKEQYGKFYDGDAYIVLHTYKQGDSDRLLYNIHFWLGAESSQDEQGVAAYKTVELDDLLGDVPVQHREVQGSESEEFLALFKNKITLMHGGIESGFRHVKPEEYKPRLFHLKGKREIRVTEVKLDLKSLNDGDVFVLDAGLDLYVWNGRTAGAYERKQARDTTQELREERNGRPKIKILDGLEDDEKFWKLLGGAKPKPGDIAPPTSDDVKIEHTNILMKLSDASGELKFTEISKGDAKKSDFKSEDVFIFDIGHTVFAWIGKGASKAERANGIKYAETYLKNHSRPAHTPVIRILEGVEPVSFSRNVK